MDRSLFWLRDAESRPQWLSKSEWLAVNACEMPALR